jgi:hypothetical protein
LRSSSEVGPDVLPNRVTSQFSYLSKLLLIIITGFHQEHRHPERVPESEEEYQARLRRSREEQVAAEERRQKEDAERKAKLEKERIRGELSWCPSLALLLFMLIEYDATRKGGKGTAAEGQES